MSVNTAATTAPVTPEEAHAIGVEAYLYLYPLVLMELTRRQMTNLPPGRRLGFGPMGAFSHAREFPPAGFRTIVRPNFDTLYSSAWLDLRHGPVVVSAPDTQGRYYVLPMYDMWTDTFAAPGSRTTGTAAADFAVLPPGWRGDLPAGLTPVQAPTAYVWVIGRTQTNGPADYDAVHHVQDGLSVTPLSRWRGTPAGADEPFEADPGVDMDTDPVEQVRAMSASDFLAAGARLMAVHAPHVTDWSVLARMRRIGVRPGGGDLGTVPDAVVRTLDGVPAEAERLMHAALPHLADIVDGWEVNTQTMGVYGNSYLKRAVVALVGLGALPAEDAVYPLAIADADGRPLDGAHDYVLHFDAEALPPVGAFWSVTMYDDEGFQVANELDRFALGDRDPLVHGDDGSLDLYLQHSHPGPEREANWLPAPRGPLGVTMRLYAPAPPVLRGEWAPPPIVRVP
jgi:hypothetical protein